MARRATLLQGLNREQTILVDAGDFSGAGGGLNRIRVGYLLQGLKLLGYDAINLGEKDLQYGTQFLLEFQKRHRIPFVSANIRYTATRNNFVAPFVIKEISGGQKKMKVGIFGLVLPELVLPEAEKGLLVAMDPIETARQVVPQLQKQCRIIIALSHLGSRMNKKLAETVSGIDVIIGGHGYSIYTEPLKLSGTIVVQGRNKGQYLHFLSLNLLDTDKIESFAGHTQKLDDAVPEAPEIVRLLSEYKQDRRAFLIQSDQK